MTGREDDGRHSRGSLLAWRAARGRSAPRPLAVLRWPNTVAVPTGSTARPVFSRRRLISVPEATSQRRDQLVSIRGLPPLLIPRSGFPGCLIVVLPSFDRCVRSRRPLVVATLQISHFIVVLVIASMARCIHTQIMALILMTLMLMSPVARAPSPRHGHALFQLFTVMPALLSQSINSWVVTPILIANC